MYVGLAKNGANIFFPLRIWALADLNKDGKLSMEEFAIANFLIEQNVGGGGGDSSTIPDNLPEHLLPPADEVLCTSGACSRGPTVPHLYLTTPWGAPFAAESDQIVPGAMQEHAQGHVDVLSRL